MKPRVLVVDDDEGVRYTLREILEANDLEAAEAADGQEALARLPGERVDLIITDLMMPRASGMDLLLALSRLPEAPPAIVITAHGSERHAVAAMKRGALDYFAKPFDADEVLRVVERAVAAVRREQENEALRAELLLQRHLVFVSEAMRQVALLVLRAAPRDVTVLISGPSGTGKERIAEAIVAASSRSERPFVRFNCAALPRELAEAELFGHARGAFTGAHRARPGLFREADGGTLLLDEIGELDLSTQGKLLRVLQEGLVRPVGEDREARVDVRLLSATNRDLRQEVRAGRFREDLYYRLKVVEVRVPPLSERPEDIPLLIDHFLCRYRDRFGLESVRLSPGLRRGLCAASFPGNVRELEHRIESLVALSAGGEIDETALELVGPSASSTPLGLRERLEAFERGLILEELQRCGGNRSEAARRLGIGRVTLLERMKRYGVT
jgi:two-component system response regulator HydG